MRQGGDVHSKSPSASERPRWLYLGSYDKSVCLMRRMLSVVGRGASQLGGAATSIGFGFSPSWVDESDSRVSTEVLDREPVFAITKTRSGAL
jgi:hypothetical protein